MNWWKLLRRVMFLLAFAVAVGSPGRAEVPNHIDNFVYPPTIDLAPAVWGEDAFALTGRMEDGATVTVTAPDGPVIGAVSYPTVNSWRCAVSGLATGSHLFTVTATDDAGNLSLPATATLTVDLGLPPQVTGLTATDTLQGGTVRLDWSSYPGAAASYSLYVAGAPFADVAGMTAWRSYPAGTTGATVVGLADNQPAYLAVVAIGAQGQFLTAVQGVTATPTRQGLYGTAMDFTREFPLNRMQVRINGYPPVVTDTHGRYVLTGIPAGTYAVTIGEVGGDVRYTTRTYPAVTVASGRVALKNLYIFSKVHHLDCGIPGNLVATGGDGKVTLCWDPLTAADLSGYILYRDGVALQQGSAPWTDRCFTDTAVTNGTTYSYAVSSWSRGNIQSDATAEVVATPQVATLPPVDLLATLGCDGRVTLSWLRPACSDLLGYNVYQQSGTEMGYGSFAALAGVDATTWQSPVLAGGSHTFAVRSVGSSGEEGNTHVVVTITVPADWNQPQAVVTIPPAGKRIDGNAVHVQAEPLAPGCGLLPTASVRFQFRPDGGNWLDIPAALAQYPNPDPTAPFFTKWDVTALPEGEYDLRAVAVTGHASAAEPGFITVTVDHHQPEVAANRTLDNSGVARSEVERGRISEVGAGWTQVSFAPHSLAADTTLLLTSVPSERLPAGSGALLLPAVDLSLASGQTGFPAGGEVMVGLSCPDGNDDGVVDGTGYFAEDLEPVTFTAASGIWEPLAGTTYDQAGRQVVGSTSHFSVFGIRARSGLPPAATPGLLSLPAVSTTGNYLVSWQGSFAADSRYELQQAGDAAFSQQVTTLYTGSNSSFAVSGNGNGNWYYRVRTVAHGCTPSAWQTGSSPVTVSLACAGISMVNVPASSVSGVFQLSWRRSATPGVMYEIQVDDGRGFRFLTVTTVNVLSLSGIPSGNYTYRVKAVRAGYADSAWTQSGPVSVTTVTAPPAALYAQESSSSGNYRVLWRPSPTPEASYRLYENGVEIYSGFATYVNITGRRNGSYSYAVRATKAGYGDSPLKGPVTTTVILACDPIPAILVPSGSTTGNYQVSWSRIRTPGVTYVLEESANAGGSWAGIATTTGNAVNLSGQGDGGYLYRVKATKDGYADSPWRQSAAVRVTGL